MPHDCEEILEEFEMTDEPQHVDKNKSFAKLIKVCDTLT